jgi:hypothetical protein
VRDEETQRVASSWHIRSPIKGIQHPQALYLSLDWEVSFTPLRVGWHRAVRFFPLGITQERRLKPPGLDLTGGGGIGPYLVLWRRTCLGWLSPVNGDPGSTQILTRHCGAQSQTVSQLESSGTTPTGKSPQFSPSGLSKHLRTGSVRMPHHILTTRMEPWGFIKSSTQTYIAHMKLSLRLCFSAQAKPRGPHDGHHHRIPKPDHGGFKPHNHTSESHGSPRSII